MANYFHGYEVWLSQQYTTVRTQMVLFFSAESTVGIGKKHASEFSDLHYKEATLHTSILQK